MMKDQTPNNPDFLTSKKSLRRAATSITCLPFKKAFYELIDLQAVSSEELCSYKDWQHLVFVPFGAKRAEEHFEWLIRVGVVRREVDGQGLTNRIRLTPMGRNIIREFSSEIPRAGIRERIYENLRRHIKAY